MSVGPMNPVVISVAGTALAQAASSDVLRARQDALVQQRGLEAVQQTEDAWGIGKTDGEDNQTNERDADGRTPWLIGRQDPALPKEETAEDALPEPAVSDASGERGGQLDLSG
jgi:hypothetical protein